MGILQVLASGNFITVSKPLARAIGLDEAVILGELASEYCYWESRGELQDGYFYSTVENVEENTTLSDYRQRKALKTLQDMGLIEVVRKGIPARRYIRIVEEQVAAIFENKFSKNLRTVDQNLPELDTKNLEANNNKETIIENNNKNNNPQRHRYGEYSNVLLTDSDLSKLKGEFPNDWQERIERLSAYMASTGKSYKNHLATIRNWARRDNERAKQEQPKQNPERQAAFDEYFSWA